MILRLANGRELRGAVVDPETGAKVWALGGRSASRELAAEIAESRARRDFIRYAPVGNLTPADKRRRQSLLLGRTP